MDVQAMWGKSVRVAGLDPERNFVRLESSKPQPTTPSKLPQIKQANLDHLSPPERLYYVLGRVTFPINVK